MLSLLIARVRAFFAVCPGAILIGGVSVLTARFASFVTLFLVVAVFAILLTVHRHNPIYFVEERLLFGNGHFFVLSPFCLYLFFYLLDVGLSGSNFSCNIFLCLLAFTLFGFAGSFHFRKPLCLFCK